MCVANTITQCPQSESLSMFNGVFVQMSHEKFIDSNYDEIGFRNFMGEVYTIHTLLILKTGCIS